MERLDVRLLSVFFLSYFLFFFCLILCSSPPRFFAPPQIARSRRSRARHVIARAQRACARNVIERDCWLVGSALNRARGGIVVRRFTSEHGGDLRQPRIAEIAGRAQVRQTDTLSEHGTDAEKRQERGQAAS